MPVAARATGNARSSSGFDWLGAVEGAAGALLGGGGDDDSEALEGDAFSDGTGDASTPLGDAQTFEYTSDGLSDDVMELAARGASDADEAECFAQYERDMDLCNALGGPMGGARGISLCKQQAFQNYQQCRGY